MRPTTEYCEYFEKGIKKVTTYLQISNKYHNFAENF